MDRSRDASGTGGGKDTVLFVDDDPSLLEGLQDALRKQPFRIETAGSAAEALARLAQVPIDIVVSDEQMPGLSGSELLAQVRQRFPDSIRILLTGQASLDAAIRAINEGQVYRFLTKPCNPMQLAHVIRDALALKRLAKASTHLLDASRRQRTVLEALEREHPGITHVPRADDGSVILDPFGDEPPPVDHAVLAEEIERELGLIPTRG